MFLLVPAYPGCPGKEAVKWFVVVACVLSNVAAACIQVMFNVLTPSVG